MTRPLSLAGLGRRSAENPARRPGAQVLWVHATSDLRLRVLCALTRQLRQVRDDVQVIASYDPALTHSAAQEQGCFDLLVPLHAQGSPQGRQILKSWAPDLGLWTGGQLGHPLIRQAADAGTEMLLLDADPAGMRGRTLLFFADPVQEGLTRFAHILVHGAEPAETLVRAGVAAERIEHTGPLRDVPEPPDCPDEDVAEVSQALAGRPVWLAALPHVDEFPDIISAHRSAVRLAHRLLLVVQLEDGSDPAALQSLLDDASLRHSLWQLGDPIEDQTQVLISSDPMDLGLWYRIAPQCFLGHSLIEGGAGHAPLHAAALGSAVLHGPSVGLHADAYERLTRAGAARRVQTTDQLGAEVARLMAPDLAAQMALAGWDVATEGAELGERLLTLVQDRLDAAEARHARA